MKVRSRLLRSILTKAHESSEKGLFHVRILLEGLIFDDWWQLVMITNHDPPFEPIETVLGVLEQKRDESFNFENLSALFHQNVVELEAKFNELLALQGSVSTRHGNDFCFL